MYFQKININMQIIDKIKTNKHGHCRICNAPTQEELLLVNQLRNRIYAKFICQSRNAPKNTKKSLKKSLETNRRLISVVFGQNSDSASSECFHEKLFNFFKKKVRCSSAMLAQISEDIIIKLGHRNYQLDMLQTQMSNVWKTAVNISLESHDGEEPPKSPQVKREQQWVQKGHKNMEKTDDDKPVKEAVARTADKIMDDISRINGDNLSNNLYFMPYWMNFENS